MSKINKEIGLRDVFNRFKEQILDYKSLAIAILFFSALYGFTHTGLILLIKKVTGGDFLLLHRRTIILVLAGLLGMTIFRGVVNFIVNFFFIRLSQRLNYNLQHKLYSKIHALPLNFFKQRPSGEIISSLTNDVVMANEASMKLISVFSKELWTITGIIIAMLYIDIYLTFLFLVTFPLFVFFLKWMSRSLRTLTHKSQEQIAQFLAMITETLRAIRLIKISARGQDEVRRFGDLNMNLLKRMSQLATISMIGRPVTEVLVVISMIGCIIWGIYSVDSGDMERSKLISFLVAIVGLYGPLNVVGGLNAALQRSVVGLTRIAAVMDEPPEPFDLPNKRRFTGIQKDIVFDDVSFSYDGRRQELKNISFNISPGQTIAIVGRTGQGKTTLIEMLPRFLEPSAGFIRIDGIDYREFDLISIRQKIAYATQETCLLRGTIRDNITYATDAAADEEIIEAARRAHIHDFIVSLPHGYQTYVGENGVNLSGGERQRIVLARELLRRTPILILDEATSEIDIQTENIILRSLANVNEGCITFIVSHRLLSVMDASLIVVIENGGIVEMGNHSELMSKQGVYWSLFELQGKGIDV